MMAATVKATRAMPAISRKRLHRAALISLEAMPVRERYFPPFFLAGFFLIENLGLLIPGDGFTVAIGQLFADENRAVGFGIEHEHVFEGNRPDVYDPLTDHADASETLPKHFRDVIVVTINQVDLQFLILVDRAQAVVRGDYRR